MTATRPLATFGATDGSMVEIAGARYRIGSDRHYPEEAPVREVELEAFLVDRHPVTNREFARFVADTGYTTLSETLPDPKLYPGLLPDMAIAGSIVFVAPPAGAEVSPDSWWRFIPGAHWRAPYGPEAGAAAPDDHPVVHVAYEDALAFARWAGKRLPTEAEAEIAARGGLADAEFAWGDVLRPGGKAMANIWNEGFPFEHRRRAGPPYTTAVGCYPANGYGLLDCIGNVWEWTSTDVGAHPASHGCCGLRSARDPGRSKVLKGGSHLCAPNYCRRYRPAAKWFQPLDTSTSHVGFRCARSIA